MVIPKVVALAYQWGPHLSKSLLQVAPRGVTQHLFAQALNHVLNDELVADKFAFLRQRWVLIEVPDLALKFSVSLANQGLRPRLQVTFDGPQADVTMRGNSEYLLLMLSGKVDPDTLFFRRKLLIKGDTELGLEVKNLLDTIELNQRLPKPIFRFNQALAERILQQQAYTPSGVSKF